MSLAQSLPQLLQSPEPRPLEVAPDRYFLAAILGGRLHVRNIPDLGTVGFFAP